MTLDSLDSFRNRPVPLTVASPAIRAATIDIVPPGWATVIEYTDPSLAGIGRRLATRGVPEPEAGGEVGDGTEVWQVEYSWPRERLAVVVDVDDARDEWLTRHGWRVLAYHEADQEGLVHEIEAAFEVAG